MTDTPPTARDRDAAARELKRASLTGDCLSTFDRDIIGHGDRRLQVPLRDPIDLRRVAIILRDLATRLEVCSHMRGEARHVLFTAHSHIREAAGKLRSKPTRNYR
jgi:hypothetical protein